MRKGLVDPISLVGEVISIALNGKSEDLPLDIGSFKVTATRKNAKGTFLVGFDEEGSKLLIPFKNIQYLIKYHKKK